MNSNGSIGASLFLITIGAILAWAVEATISGIDIRVAGTILMVIGVVGLVLSLLFWSAFAPFARREARPVVAAHDHQPVHIEPVRYVEAVHEEPIHRNHA